MTPRAIALYQTYDAVVWRATPVEIASALARLMRMKQLDFRGWAEASKLATNLADSWSVIQPSGACGRRRYRLWSATTCGSLTRFSWRRLWSGANTFLRAAFF